MVEQRKEREQELGQQCRKDLHALVSQVVLAEIKDLQCGCRVLAQPGLGSGRRSRVMADAIAAPGEEEKAAAWHDHWHRLRLRNQLRECAPRSLRRPNQPPTPAVPDVLSYADSPSCPEEEKGN